MLCNYYLTELRGVAIESLCFSSIYKAENFKGISEGENNYMKQ